MARAAALRWRSTDVRFVDCAMTRQNLAALGALLSSGAVRVVVDRVYPLHDAAAAVAHMASHRARGKVVVAVGDGRG